MAALSILGARAAHYGTAVGFTCGTAETWFLKRGHVRPRGWRTAKCPELTAPRGFPAHAPPRHGACPTAPAQSESDQIDDLNLVCLAAPLADVRPIRLGDRFIGTSPSELSAAGLRASACLQTLADHCGGALSIRPPRRWRRVRIASAACGKRHRRHAFDGRPRGGGQ